MIHISFYIKFCIKCREMTEHNGLYCLKCTDTIITSDNTMERGKYEENKI